LKIFKFFSGNENFCYEIYSRITKMNLIIDRYSGNLSYVFLPFDGSTSGLVLPRFEHDGWFVLVALSLALLESMLEVWLETVGLLLPCVNGDWLVLAFEHFDKEDMD